jgi:hypothetical protein
MEPRIRMPRPAVSPFSRRFGECRLHADASEDSLSQPLVFIPRSPTVKSAFRLQGAINLLPGSGVQ